MDNIESRLSTLTESIQQIALKLSALPTREEVEKLLKDKVSNERFDALAQRVAELEANPKSVRDWIAVGFGGCGLFLSVISVGITIIVLLASHWR